MMKKSGGLALINDYGSDTDDEQVPGPRVSTKRTHKDESEENFKKRLPLPDAFLHKNNSENEHVDDPQVHNGRLRSFAHERGIWASYIYIPFEKNEATTEFVDFIKNNVSENFEMFEVDNFHLSLTKTVILRHHWIESFVQSIKDSVTKFRRFMILFNGLKIYCNDEKTRTFIGIQARTGLDTLEDIVSCLDKCLNEFQLPPFYQDLSFHMSMAWCLGDKTEELTKYLTLFNQKLSEINENYPEENFCIIVEFLIAKIGNKYFQFHLS